VTTYTITITADDDSAATTRLRLDVSADQVILTDLHLHDGNGLSGGQLPAIDYGLLLAAITTSTPTPLSSPTPPPVLSRDTTPAPTAVTGKTPARRRARTAAPAAAPKARRAGRGSADTPAAATPHPAAGGRRRAGTADKAAAAANKSVPAARKTATRARPARASGATSGGTGRAYRRMPDDFAAVYQQAGSASVVAGHYQVPRHTANGWIRRLREQGIIPTGR
jgi:hypothetical protein